MSRILIVDAAVDLLDRRGTSGLTMRSLAEALDVTANGWNDDELSEHGLDAILATTQTNNATCVSSGSERRPGGW